MNVPRHAVEILLVEDSPSDVFIVKEALKHAPGPVHVHPVVDGVEAMACLRREGIYAEAPRPDLVLLDLNVPRKDGREVLAEIKTDPGLQAIPVVVLTSSSAEPDIARAYDLHANCYLAKPADFAAFKEMMKALAAFWFGHVTLPPHE